MRTKGSYNFVCPTFLTDRQWSHRHSPQPQSCNDLNDYAECSYLSPNTALWLRICVA